MPSGVILCQFQGTYLTDDWLEWQRNFKKASFTLRYKLALSGSNRGPKSKSLSLYRVSYGSQGIARVCPKLIKNQNYAKENQLAPIAKPRCDRRDTAFVHTLLIEFDFWQLMLSCCSWVIIAPAFLIDSTVSSPCRCGSYYIRKDRVRLGHETYRGICKLERELLTWVHELSKRSFGLENLEMPT